VLCISLASSICEAALITVLNPSFESLQISDGTFATSSAPAGWTEYGSLDFGLRTVGILNPNTTTLYPGGATDGNNVGVVFLLDNIGNQSMFINSEAGMQQTLTDSLQPLTTYTLLVDVGNIANDANAPHNQFAFGGFPNYRIDLLADGNVIASDNNSLSPLEGQFLTSTIVFSTGMSVTPNQLLGIRLVNLNSDIGIEVNFDHVRLDASAVPEPSSVCALIMLGLIGLSFRLRERKSSWRGLVGADAVDYR
jgi:hypothetical protein